MPDSMQSPAKEALRARLIAARADLPLDYRSSASAAISARLAALPQWIRAHTVVLHAPLGAEVDLSALARRAVEEGKRVAWPRLREGGREMDLAFCAPAELVPGPARALEPPASAPTIPLRDVDLLVVPGVAFDAEGRRLGRGRGHFDATLAALVPGAVRVGVAFDAQVVDRVPSDPHDVPVDLLVTESRLHLGATGRRGGTSGPPGHAAG